MKTEVFKHIDLTQDLSFSLMRTVFSSVCTPYLYVCIASQTVIAISWFCDCCVFQIWLPLCHRPQTPTQCCRWSWNCHVPGAEVGICTQLGISSQVLLCFFERKMLVPYMNNKQTKLHVHTHACMHTHIHHTHARTCMRTHIHHTYARTRMRTHIHHTYARTCMRTHIHHTYARTCMRTHIHHTYARTCMRTHIHHTYARTRMRTHIHHTYARTCMRTHIHHTYARTCMRTHIHHTYARTCMRTHIHHTYARTCMRTHIHHTYARTCMRTHIHHTYARTCMRTHACTNTHYNAHGCTHGHTNIHTTHTYIYTQHTHAQTCDAPTQHTQNNTAQHPYTHTHVHTHTHTHTHTHIHMREREKKFFIVNFCGQGGPSSQDGRAEAGHERSLCHQHGGQSCHGAPPGLKGDIALWCRHVSQLLTPQSVCGISGHVLQERLLEVLCPKPTLHMKRFEKQGCWGFLR